jgi:DNA polymerase-3 subunit epsilon
MAPLGTMVSRVLTRRRAAAVHPTLRGRLQQLDFAVVDVETTGLNPRRDRILEVAVLRIGGDGRVHSEFATLVAAPRVAAEEVHGISAGDLLGAPRFAAIAATVRRQLEGAIVAGHNVAFDLAFLRKEFLRTGDRFPATPFVCTISLGRLVGAEPTRSGLTAACERQGIRVDDHHRALHDARAAGALLVAYLRQAETLGLDLSGLAARSRRDPSCRSWRRPTTGARLSGRPARAGSVPAR